MHKSQKHSFVIVVASLAIFVLPQAAAQSVGIGISTPQANLHVRGTSGLLIDNTNSTSTAQLELKTGNTPNQSFLLSHIGSSSSGTIAGVSLTGASTLFAGAGNTGSMLMGTLNNAAIYGFTNAQRRFMINTMGQLALGDADPDASARLHVQGTSGGLLLPRLNTTQRDGIASPANGLLIYNTNTNAFNFFRTGTGWIEISAGAPAAPAWMLSGNAGTNGNNFIGTLDPAPLNFRVNNTNAGVIYPFETFRSTYIGVASGNTASPGNDNTGVGAQALGLVNGGNGNTALGAGSGKNISTGTANVTVGFEAGKGIQAQQGNVAVGTGTIALRKGDYNVAIGDSAMAGSSTDIPAIPNIAIGKNALRSLRTASGNVAIGRLSLEDALTGSQNVSIGDQAMNNTTSPGNQNIGIGTSALRSNTGSNNIAIGIATLVDNTGSSNIAIGPSAANDNTTGKSNVAVGTQALLSNTTASFQIAIGDSALRLYTATQPGNIAIGVGAGKNLDMGRENTLLGYRALAEGLFTNSNVVIGYEAMPSLQGGGNNVAVGYRATIKNNIGVGATAIGSDASAGANNSTAIGYQASVTGPNRMGFGNENVTSWLFGRTTATAGRALEVGTGNTNGNGAYLTTGGTWTNNSDVNLKEDISTLDASQILAAIANLPITRWRYKGTQEYHIGPMAQDFYAAFATGVDDKSISSIDPAGVALAAIKALIAKNEKLEAELNQLKQKLENK